MMKIGKNIVVICNLILSKFSYFEIIASLDDCYYLQIVTFTRISLVFKKVGARK